MTESKRQYRAPLATGIVLLLGTLAWAWFETAQTFEREQDESTRRSDSLVEGLSILWTQTVGADREAEFARRVQRHLHLRRPFRFLLIEQDDRVLVELGRFSSNDQSHEERGRPKKPLFVVVRDIPKVRRRPPPAERRRRGAPGAPPGAPWIWVSDEASHSTPPLRISIGIDAGLAPHSEERLMFRLILGLLLSWLGIAALSTSWVRSIRGRELSAALDAEKRERARLTELNLAAAGLAHETRNPLGIILGLSQRMANTPSIDEDLKASAEQIVDEADRASARLSDFINFAALRKAKLSVVEARVLLERLVSTLRPDFGAASVALDLRADDVRIECDVSMLEQIVVNLLLNSLRASPAGSTTTVSLRAGLGTASLSVVDEGTGIPPELLPDIFKPYVSGSATGHGLGLAMTERQVTQLGWKIDLKSVVGEGTQVIVSGIKLVPDGET